MRIGSILNIREGNGCHESSFIKIMREINRTAGTNIGVHFTTIHTTMKDVKKQSEQTILTVHHRPSVVILDEMPQLLVRQSKIHQLMLSH